MARLGDFQSRVAGPFPFLDRSARISGQDLGGFGPPALLFKYIAVVTVLYARS